jgi:hypothetical protein
MMATEHTIVVYLGPTLARTEAKALCPEADIRPPARKGDILRAVLDDRATLIGLIDGEFHQSLSVWHKEILYALSSGVTVVGASSMGALRAAELGPWGMYGVGEIYQAYASGALLDDDEVALTFGEMDGEYRATSEPMVNLRASCRAAVAAGRATHRLVEHGLAVAKQMHFSERTARRMCDALAEAGEPADEVSRLRDFLAAHPVDAKANDARQLLRLLAEGGPPPQPRPKLARTVAFDTMFRRERPLGTDAVADGVDEVAARFRAHAPDADSIVKAAADRGLLLMLGRLLRIAPTPGDIARELADLRRRHGLDDDEALQAFVERNGTSDRELHTLAAEEAVCTRLRQWLSGALATEGEAPLLLDYLRLHDRLAPWLSSVDKKSAGNALARGGPA